MFSPVSKFATPVLESISCTRLRSSCRNCVLLPVTVLLTRRPNTVEMHDKMAALEAPARLPSFYHCH